jgi:hypothetical protein
MNQQEEGSPIFLVPEIILEENIFARCGNLKELSLTCQYFHDIISKSRLLMKRFQLKIKEDSYNHQVISTILASKRQYSRIEFSEMKCCENIYRRIISVKSMYYTKIIRRFKDSITELSFDHCRLNRSLLLDTFTILSNLKELKFDYTEFSDVPGCGSSFKKFPTLKRVKIYDCDLSLLSCLSETETLAVELKVSEREWYDDSDDDSDTNFDPGNNLLRYLKTHEELVSLKIDTNGKRLPALPDSVDFKLVDLEMMYGYCSENSRSTRESINFIKIQGESLKRLTMISPTLNLSEFQSVFESMKVLEYFKLQFSKVLPQSTPFAARNFTCPKLTEMELYDVKEFPFFGNFPNLHAVKFTPVSPQPDLIISAGLHCTSIRKLRFFKFDDIPEAAFFPNLVDLTVSNNSLEAKNSSSVRNFLLQHKLERLAIAHVSDVKIFKKILAGLPSLKYLKLYIDKQLITDIWPLLGNLEMLEVKYYKDIDIDIIKQEFPKIPGLKIIKSNDYYF